MAIHVERDEDGYAIWSNPEPGDKFSGRCIGVGKTLDDAKLAAISELNGDITAIDELESGRRRRRAGRRVAMQVHIIRVDGREELLTTTRDRCFHDIEKAIDADCLDSVVLDGGQRTMFVDDNGYETETVEHGPGHVELKPVRARKPVNLKATALYHQKCGGPVPHQIVGDVAIVKESDFED